MGVKINNYPRNSRPQRGLSLADIVYEYYHNNDLTRFTAIFYGNDVENAGPIRSARPFDGYLVDTYQLNFVFASADSRVLAYFLEQYYADLLIYFLDGECPPFPVCRIDPEGANLLVTDTAVIDEFQETTGVPNARPTLKGMYFHGQTPNGGDPIEDLYIRYSYGAYLRWKFDPETGRFLRFQDATEAFGDQKEVYEVLDDRVNFEQVAADNVVVLVVPHIHRVYQPPTAEAAATEIVDMKFEGSGTAYAMRDGRIYEVKWRRKEGKVVTLAFPDGTPYPFKPGNTWFQVVTPETEVDEQPEVWRMTFDLIPRVEAWGE